MKLVIDEAIVPLDKTDDIVVDPGSRHIVVTAPGRVPWESTVEVEKSKARAIAVPKLGYPVTVRKGRRNVGIIMTGIGVAALGTGIGLGMWANSHYDEQVADHCNDASPPVCDGTGFEETHRAINYATFGTYIGVAGVAIAGVGAYLWLFGAKASNEQNVAIVPTLAPDSAGVTAIGRF
jgi:hypothetical protein